MKFDATAPFPVGEIKAKAQIVKDGKIAPLATTGCPCPNCEMVRRITLVQQIPPMGLALTNVDVILWRRHPGLAQRQSRSAGRQDCGLAWLERRRQDDDAERDFGPARTSISAR